MPSPTTKTAKNSKENEGIPQDQAWSDRSTPSANIRRFQGELALYVERAVGDLIAKNKGAHDKTAVMSRLYLVSPYWCVEAWLYQNTTVAKALCHKHYRGSRLPASLSPSR